MAPTGLCARTWLGTDARGRATVSSGRRMLQQPRGLRLAPDGSLLVADFGSHCVLRFARGDAEGAVVAGEAGKALVPADPLKDIDRPLGPAEGEGFRLMRPVDACEDEQGNVLVLDAEAGRLQRFSKQHGPAETLVPPPRGPPQKSSSSPEAVKGPRAVLLEANGDLVICDTWSHRVIRYTQGTETQPPQELAGTPNSFGRGPDQLAFPSGIAWDAQGCLLVADTNNHRVQRFAPGERSATTIAGSAACAAGSGPGELSMPTGLCIDPRDGSVIVADRGNKRVLRFLAGSRAGDAAEVLAGPDVLEAPWGVCAGPDGSVYVSDERRGLVLRLSAAEDASEVPPPAPRAADAPGAPVPQGTSRAEANGGDIASFVAEPSDVAQPGKPAVAPKAAEAALPPRVSGGHAELD